MKSKRTLTDDQLNTLVADLQGTCDTLSERLPEGVEEDELTPDDLAALDEQIMCCDTCGWWVEMCEISEDGNCDDCQQELDEDGNS